MLQLLKIGVFLFKNFWWKYYSKISLWYVKEFFQQILSIYPEFNAFSNFTISLIFWKICKQFA